jgi:hypothetical protein
MLTLNGQQVTVGSDWGIQVVFGNGVTSRIRSVGEVSQHDGRVFNVNATLIFN